eukprot:1393597-Amorphochlora_amoeboformis.AAC.2
MQGERKLKQNAARVKLILPTTRETLPESKAANGREDFQKAAFSDSEDEGEKKHRTHRNSQVTFNNKDDVGKDGGQFDENMIESFDKALEKHNPTSLAAMIQLRHNIYRKKV